MLAGADEGGSALELLGGQQPEGVAHKHGDTVRAVAGLCPLANNALQAAHREGERGQAEVRLGLATTGREEQQLQLGIVGPAAGVGVGGITEAG